MASPAFTITIRPLREAKFCPLRTLLDDLAVVLGRVPDDNEPVPLAVWWSLPSTTAPDRSALLRGVAPRVEAAPLIVAFAEACAERARGYAADAHAVFSLAGARTRTLAWRSAADAEEASDGAARAADYARYQAGRFLAATAAYATAAYDADFRVIEAAAISARFRAAAASASDAASCAHDTYSAAYNATYAVTCAVERAAQRADLDRLFLGVVTDAEGVATGCPRRDPDHTARSPSVGLLGGPMQPDRVIWEIAYADEDQVDPLLADGWEPFAVVQEARDYGHRVTVVWLRRQKTEVPCG